MREMLELYRAHPGSARAAMAIIPTGSGAIRATEGMLAICLAGGISPRPPRGSATSPRSTSARSPSRSRSGSPAPTPRAPAEEPDHEAIDAQLTDYFQSLPPDLYPLTSSMATVLTTGDGSDRFEFGIDVILAGLAAVSQKYA